MEDPDNRTLRLVQFAFGLAALASAGGALAQVTPAEPFGGRPFGADRAPAQQQQAAQPTVVQPGGAPVMVQPGGAPVVVQPPQAQVAPQPQPQVQVQSQQPAQQQPAPPTPNMAGPSGRQASSVNPPSANGNGNGNGAAQQQATGSAAPPIVNPPSPVPAPAPVTPPFAANRAPAMGAAAASAPAQQQAVRGLPSDAPRLVISGSVFSPDVKRRMLIVNGQVFHEGADLGSGVMLQEVRPDSAVLDYKGGRYNVYF